jgi:hypothetical protein
MWEIVTAVSTAGTVVVALLTYLLVSRQSSILKPSISTISSGDSSNDFAHLRIDIDPPDNAKFKLMRLVATSPPTARLATITSNPKTNRPMPGDWKTEFVVDRMTPTGVYYIGPRGSVVTIEVHVALRSDTKIKSRCTITAKMHD